MNENFIIRVVSSTIYVAIIIIGIMWRFSFFFIFSLITFLCLREFYGLMNTRQKTTISFFHCFGGVCLFITIHLFASGISGFFSHRIFWLYPMYIVFVFISELYKKQQDDPIIHISYILFGQCYVALPLSFLNLIAFYRQVYSSEILLSLFIFTWANDSTSFLFGEKFGKHPLFKRISPQKSWEGFFGGLILTFLLSFVFSRFIPIFPLYHWIGIAIVISLFGTWGDLVESLIKRTLKIKDSGVAIPGHGGFLDRFDSLLLTVYALCFYLEWFMK